MLGIFFLCLIVCLRFFVPLENFHSYFHMETSPLPVKHRDQAYFGFELHETIYKGVVQFGPKTALAPMRWRAANFDLCSALMAIEQWGFFSVPHLLWHGASVYNGHLRGTITHNYCRAFGSGDVTTCCYDLGLSRLGFELPTLRLRGERSNRLRHRRGFFHHATYCMVNFGSVNRWAWLNDEWRVFRVRKSCLGRVGCLLHEFFFIYIKNAKYRLIVLSCCKIIAVILIGL